MKLPDFSPNPLGPSPDRGLGLGLRAVRGEFRGPFQGAARTWGW